MNRGEHLQLLGEKTALERMIAETPEEDVLDHASLSARLTSISEALAVAKPDEREPARVRLTFKGRPVIGSHGIFAEFGMKAVNAFTESVVAMAASLTAPLAAMGPIPNRDQHQSLLRGTQGTDDELADSAVEADRRALDKVRAFLSTLADNEAVCTVQFGESIVSSSDVGQVRTSIERLSQENLREKVEQLPGELQGVLPKARIFEFRLADSSQVIRGKISPTVGDPDALNSELHRPSLIKVMVTRVGNGRPRYLLLQAPEVRSIM